MDIFIGREEYVGTLLGYKKNRVFKGVELWCQEPQISTDHYYDCIINDTLYVVWGSFYEQDRINPAELAANTLIKYGEEKLFELDGEFLFARIISDNEMLFIQCNYNLPDVYYKKCDSQFILASEPKLLLNGLFESDVDEKTVFDYLSYGRVVGRNTFSQKVKSLCRGQKLVISEGVAKASYDHVMHYSGGKEHLTIEDFTNELYDTYLNGLYKRAFGKVDDSVVFLSGGLDSRLVLAAFNELFDKKVTCVSFGQPDSVEVSSARTVSKIGNNPHIILELTPGDFVDNAQKYSEMTAGMDQFPQSYIFKVVSELKNFKWIFPGSNLTDIFFHAGVHRQYLNEEILSYKGSFSSYLITHLENARMNGIKPELLRKICQDDVIFSNNHLLEDAEFYDNYNAPDIYSGYLNNNDATHTIAFRTNYIPGRFMNSIDPSGDKKFAKLLTQLPIEYRMTDELHTRMLAKFSADYLKPVYPNINLSAAIPTKYWAKAIELEKQREMIYETALLEYNNSHTNKIYYPYYYSDFNGYSRYDKKWRAYLSEMLLNKDSYIYTRWIKYDSVSQMLDKHMKSEQNYRRELVVLASLEQFFRVYLNI